jgi:N-methylhydantoinase A
VPAQSGAFSALGCLVSPLRYDAVQTYRASLDTLDPKPLDDRFRELEAQCTRPLLEEGVAAARITVLRSVDLRYVGQNYEIDVPYVREATRLRRNFEARHRQLYGYATGEGVECVNARVVAMVIAKDTVTPARTRAAGRAEPTGTQRAWFRGAGGRAGDVRLTRYARASLGARAVVGPALIEDEWSTTIVAPGQRCTATPAGDLVIEIGR